MTYTPGHCIILISSSVITLCPTQSCKIFWNQRHIISVAVWRRGKKDTSPFFFFFTLWFHAGSLFALWHIIRLWPDNWFTLITVRPVCLSSFQSHTWPSPTISFILSSMCSFLSSSSHPLCPGLFSVSAALNISVHLLSSFGLTQIMLRVLLWLSMYWLCVSMVSPITPICSLPLFPFWVRFASTFLTS